MILPRLQNSLPRARKYAQFCHISGTGDFPQMRLPLQPLLRILTFGTPWSQRGTRPQLHSVTGGYKSYNIFGAMRFICPFDEKGGSGTGGGGVKSADRRLFSPFGCPLSSTACPWRPKGCKGVQTDPEMRQRTPKITKMTPTRATEDPQPIQRQSTQKKNGRSSPL